MPLIRKKKSVAKKVSTCKRTVRKKPETPVDTPLNAIGLARPVDFMDFQGAMNVLVEAKTRPVMNRFEWQANSLRTFMSIWEAESHMLAFRQAHVDAAVQKRYKVEDKTILELSTMFDDGRADHRVVYQAHNR